MKRKTQHFVPQFYLRSFTSDGDKIHVYDKDSNKTFKSSVKNVACENYFYDDPLMDEENKQEQFLEKFYEKIESEFAPFYNYFLDRIKFPHSFQLLDSDKDSISKYLVSQIDRTNEHREESYQYTVEMYNQLKEKGFSEVQLIKMGFDSSNFDKKQLHLESLNYGFEKIETFTEILKYHIWIILRNNTSQVFYTSDHPVVKNGHLKEELKSNEGFGSPGIEVAFPISSRFLLVMCDRELFSHYEPLENKVLTIKLPKNIDYYNSLQVASSYRQVFCEIDQFELVNIMKKETPSVFTIDKKRV